MVYGVMLLTFWT